MMSENTQHAEDEPAGEDDVVLLDAALAPSGTMPKSLVHGTDTPLHLAFSVHIVDGSGHYLLTRRSLAKRAWPGIWTNACCGHPRPNESIEAAAHRRLRAELGLVLPALTCVVPDFRYRAIDDSGIAEHEHCPVFLARVGSTRPQLRPDPTEVMAWRWVPGSVIDQLVREAPWLLSPWSVEQFAAIAA